MTQLSLAIPFYSRKDYLRLAIDSVLRQSCPRWNLLIADDASAETGVAELVASYRDERIRYHRNPVNLGMARNWNHCLDLADNDLVTLLHADDELLSNYVEIMLAAAAAHPEAAAFFCGARVIDDTGKPYFSFPDYVKRWFLPRRRGPIGPLKKVSGPLINCQNLGNSGRGEGSRHLFQRAPLVLHGQHGLSALLRGNFIMCPTLCYRKSVLGGRRFHDQWKMVQDLELTTRLLLEGESLVGLSDLGYAYRRHAANATVQYTASMLRFDEETALYRQLTRAARDRHWRRAAATAQEKRVLKLHLLYRTALDVLHLQLPRAAKTMAYLLRMK